MKTFKIGKDHTEPIKIDDSAVSVSHDHAEITIDDNGHWWLIDKGSTNGTFVETDAKFARVGRISIQPNTWIRLGQEGIRGCTFKARRVLSPNDYSQDFAELKHLYNEYKQINNKLESRNMLSRCLPFILSALIFICTIDSKNTWLLKIMMLGSGAFATLAQILLTENLKRKKKKIYNQLICPKCRRHISEDDINAGYHPFCQAH